MTSHDFRYFSDDEITPRPLGIDTTTPSAARLYDYYLGGKDNFDVDRQAAQQIFEKVPELPALARENRAFLKRVVSYLAKEHGIRQFLDIGSGLPAAENTHQVVQSIIPDARVVYVDNDPIVLAHGRAILADNPHTTVITAEMRDPESILNDPDALELIDFEQPVALLFIAVLHFLCDGTDQPADVVARYRSALAPGSHLVITHLDSEAHPERAAHVEQIYADTNAPLQTRNRSELSEFFGDFETAEPGLVYIADWRPEAGTTPARPEDVWGIGGVARRP